MTVVIQANQLGCVSTSRLLPYHCQLLLCILLLLLLIGSYFSIYCSTEGGRLSDLGTMPTGAAYVECGLYVSCSDCPNETITHKW